MTGIQASDAYQRYTDYLDMLISAIRPLVLLPLAEMAEANERMQTLAPFVARPIEYHGGARNLEGQRAIIDAASALQRAVARVTGVDQAPGGGS